MIPTTLAISTRYLEYGGKVDDWFLNAVSSSLYVAKQDQLFADAVTGETDSESHINWTSVNANAAKLIYIMARKLAQEKSSLHAAHFLYGFRLYHRNNLTVAEQAILTGLELQSG